MNASKPSKPQSKPKRLGEIIHDVLRQLAQAQAVTRMVAQSGDEDGDDVGLSLEVVDRLLGQASDRLSHLEQILQPLPLYAASQEHEQGGQS
jgi:hypothetical protein